MEKKKRPKKWDKIAYVVIGGIFAFSACICSIFGQNTTIETKADGITTDYIDNTYYNVFQGWQISVKRPESNEYRFSDSMPTSVNNAGTLDITNSVYYDTVDENNNLVTGYFMTEITSTLENNRVTVRCGGGYDEMILWTVAPQVWAESLVRNSFSLTYFKTRTEVVYTFTFQFLTEAGNKVAFPVTLRPVLENGYYVLQPVRILEVLEALVFKRSDIWQSIDGERYAYLLQGYFNVQPLASTVLSFIYTYYYSGRGNILGIKQVDYINSSKLFKHYESVNISGVFDFVNAFFSTEIFEGFTFGTLLIMGIGALLVTMLLKIFLGG